MLIARPWERNEFELLAHEHAPPAGVPSLRTTLAARVHQRTGDRSTPGCRRPDPARSPIVLQAEDFGAP